MVVADGKEVMSSTVTTNHPQATAESLRISTAYSYKYFTIREDLVATMNILQK